MMFIVTEEGGSYDWSSHTNLFVVPTEELAKMLVELLQEEKNSAKKFMKDFPNVWRMSDSKKAEFNRLVEEHFKYYHIERHEMFQTGRSAYSFINSDWYECYDFGYEEARMKYEL